jgi:Cation transporter/ATPase, N-terminus
MKTIDNPVAEKHTGSLDRFWTQTPEVISTTLRCGLEGLSSSDAEQRLAQYGPNSDAETKADSLLRAIFRRLLEPLSLILLAAGIVICCYRRCDRRVNHCCDPGALDRARHRAGRTCGQDRGYPAAIGGAQG